MRLEHANQIFERMATTREPITDLTFGYMLQALAIVVWDMRRERREVEQYECVA